MPALTPHGQLLETARGSLSARKAATAAGISDARWRQIVTGVQKVGNGIEVPVTTKPQTLVAMARAVGADVAAVLDAAGMRVDPDDLVEEPADQPDLEQRLQAIERRLANLEREEGEGRADAGPAATKTPEVGPADQPTKDDVTLAAAEGDRDPRDEAEETERST